MSQSILPGNFSVKGLSVIERRRLEYYYEQYVLRRSWIYGEGHFILACYAALPVVLTPDLLYKLWLNFKDYWWEEKHAVIHPVAPADLLLSPLVEEIGHELYEIPESIRQVLLLHLKEITGEFAPNPQQLYKLTEIAQFLHCYAQYDFTPANKNDDAFREAQIWTALSYLDPGQAFGQLVNKYKQAKDKSPDQLRYANALGNMSRRFMLDIVRDPALVPQAHKAVTALTSVVKDVLNDRNPARLAELQREIMASDDVELADAPVVKENVISVPIDELVTERLGGVQKKNGKGKLRALVVGTTREVSNGNKNALKANHESALLFGNMLLDFSVNMDPQFEFTMLTEQKATKQAILEGWTEIIANADLDDDLLFYLSGSGIAKNRHCCVLCADSDNSEEQTWLFDEEIGRLTNAKQVASVTMIIQTDHAATEYWLDAKKDGNVVFASCQYGQDPYLNVIRTEEYESVSLFTFAMEKALREKRMQISNRSLFALALEYYHDELVLKNNEDSVWDKGMPVLLCNTNSYDLFFAQGRNYQVGLQNALRDNGFYTGNITGVWDAYTAKALVASGAPAGLSKQRYIEFLNEQKKTRFTEQPVFLFIFSDPGEKLQELERERQQIIGILSDEALAYRVHIHELHNPDSKVLMDFFINPANRNRIQLVYYSGFDEKGNFLLKDGAFSIGGFVGLLEYQQNIQLFVSNTCRSEYFAEFVSMLGVPLAIGVKGEISDSAGADFGIELFKTIVEVGRLNMMRNLGRPYIYKRNGFILYENDTEAVLPWKFKEEVKKIKVFISYERSEQVLVNKLKERIRTSLHNLEIWDGRDDGDGREHSADLAANSDVILVCISPRYVRSEFFKLEQEIIRNGNSPVIGIDLYLDDKTNNLPEYSGAKLFARLPGKFYPNHLPVVFSDFTGTLNKDNYAERLSEEFLKELSEDIEQSLDKKNNVTVFVAQDEFPSFDGVIIGREELLLQIDERLSPELPLLLRGTVGVGKTTAAIAYCKNEQFTSKYQFVIWVDGSKGILEGIGNALMASEEIRSLIDWDHYEYSQRGESDGHELIEVRLLPGNNLLVIDNANDPLKLSDFMDAFVNHKVETNCLVISRCNLYEDNNMGIVVDPLSLADASLLYQRFSHKIFQEEYFKAIYEHVNGNVLLIEALAKFADNLSDTSQLFHFLIIPSATFEQRPFEKNGLMYNVYRSVNLDKELNDLVRMLSLFPVREFSRQLFLTLLGEQQAVKIEALTLAGWLEQIEENYKIPFIVKVIFRTELMPDVENCSQLITRLMDLLDDINGENIAELLTIGVSVVKDIGLSGSKNGQMEMGKLNLKLGRRLMNNERLAEGLDVVKRAVEIFARKNEFINDNIDALQLAGELTYMQGELAVSVNYYRDCCKVMEIHVRKVSGSEKDELQLKLIIVYHKIGSLRQKLREYDTAVKAYSDALQLKKVLDKRGLMEDWIVKLGIKCHEGIGEVYLETEKYELALVSFEEGLSLLKKWGGFEDGDEIKNSLQKKIKQAEDSINKQKNPQGNFLSEAELFSVVERSGKLTAPDKPLKSLLMFQSETQKTWLIVTSKYLFVIVDEEYTRKENQLIQMFSEKDKIMPLQMSKEDDENSYFVKFACEDTWWYYSRSLFSNITILWKALEELVSEKKREKNPLSGLELEYPKARYTRSDGDNTISLSAGKLQAFIVDRTLVCFAAEIAKQQRLDVLDLLLFAQLAARGQYPEIEHAMDWHRSFTNVLTNIGCTIDAREFSQFAFPGKAFRLENSLMNMMVNVSFKDNLTDFLDKSLAAIKRFNAKRGGYIHSFEINTHSDNNAAFQVCLVANSDGALELNFGIAVLTSNSPIEKLFGVWSTDNTKLYYSTLRGTFNEHLYANVRDTISEKLSFSKGMYIVGVKLY